MNGMTDKDREPIWANRADRASQAVMVSQEDRVSQAATVSRECMGRIPCIRDSSLPERITVKL